jgi:hypothetical protein
MYLHCPSGNRDSSICVTGGCAWGVEGEDSGDMEAIDSSPFRMGSWLIRKCELVKGFIAQADEDVVLPSTHCQQSEKGQPLMEWGDSDTISADRVSVP